MDLWYVDERFEAPSTAAGLDVDKVWIEPQLERPVTAVVAGWTWQGMTLDKNHAIQAVRADTARLFIRRLAATLWPVVEYQPLTGGATDRLIHLSIATEPSSKPKHTKHSSY